MITIQYKFYEALFLLLSAYGPVIGLALTLKVGKKFWYNSELVMTSTETMLTKSFGISATASIVNTLVSSQFSESQYNIVGVIETLDAELIKFTVNPISVPCRLIMGSVNVTETS